MAYSDDICNVKNFIFSEKERFSCLGDCFV